MKIKLFLPNLYEQLLFEIDVHLTCHLRLLLDPPPCQFLTSGWAQHSIVLVKLLLQIQIIGIEYPTIDSPVVQMFVDEVF